MEKNLLNIFPRFELLFQLKWVNIIADVKGTVREANHNLRFFLFLNPINFQPAVVVQSIFNPM